MEVRAAAADARENAAALAAAADEADARAATLATERADLIETQDRLRARLADAERQLAVMEARADAAEGRADQASAGWHQERLARDS